MSRVVILHVQEIYVFDPLSVDESYQHNPLFTSVDVDENVIQSFEFLDSTSLEIRCLWDLEPTYKANTRIYDVHFLEPGVEWQTDHAKHVLSVDYRFL